MLSWDIHLVYCLLVKVSGTKYRGLATQKITPMLGVLKTEPSTVRCFILAASLARGRSDGYVIWQGRERGRANGLHSVQV
jgi:hypothetical protein